MSLSLQFQEKEKFEEIYNSFQSTVGDMERFLGAYLHAIFARKMKTSEGLAIMNRYIDCNSYSVLSYEISEFLGKKNI